ncbi:MAG: hypothetical protein IJA65_01585 [Acholeplasmatales bacterium]|nr:hypothetical protein [Acholeplasmatales bacterium]
MDKLKIIGWTHFDSIYPTRKYDKDTFNIIFSLICDEIIEKKYLFSGEEHQYSFTGVPLFSDGTCFRASMRSWGVIMASIYSGPNGEKLSYMDFYMSLGDDAIMPEYSEIEIKPAIVEEISFGCTTQADRQIISESLAMNMEFMTTDKVLKKLYEKLKNEEQ